MRFSIVSVMIGMVLIGLSAFLFDGRPSLMGFETFFERSGLFIGLMGVIFGVVSAWDEDWWDWFSIKDIYEQFLDNPTVVAAFVVAWGMIIASVVHGALWRG